MTKNDLVTSLHTFFTLLRGDHVCKYGQKTNKKSSLYANSFYEKKCVN